MVLAPWPGPAHSGSGRAQSRFQASLGLCPPVKWTLATGQHSASAIIGKLRVPPIWAGGHLTEVWGSDPPVTATSPAASGPASREGNSLRLQVLLRLEHREWEEAQAWKEGGAR